MPTMGPALGIQNHKRVGEYKGKICPKCDLEAKTAMEQAQHDMLVEYGEFVCKQLFPLEYYERFNRDDVENAVKIKERLCECGANRSNYKEMMHEECCNGNTKVA